MIYRDDLHGYDDLITFVDLFPTYDVFVDLINDYMFFEEFSLDDGIDRKIFTYIFKRYKNHFFRWATPATILSHMSGSLEELKQELKVINDISNNLKSYAGTTTTDKDYKTSNTMEENISGFLTNERTSFVDNGELEMKVMSEGVTQRSAINRRVEAMRSMFMNYTNEVVIKEGIYTKGGR